MPKIKIVTDAACDISLKNEELYDIEVIPFTINVNGEAYNSRTELDNTEFYEMLDDTDDVPTTEPISSFVFGELFGELFYQGYTDVIYIAVNSNGSESYYNSIQAKDQFFEDIPEASGNFNIYCIDSLSYSAGIGLAVVEAAKMADRGEESIAIVKYLRSHAESIALCFGLYSLKYAKKSEKIPTVTAGVGEIIGIRHILTVSDGELNCISKVLGDASVIPAITENVLNNIVPKSPYCIIYGEDADEKAAITSALTKALGYPPTDAYRISPVIACHTGSEVTGVAFRQKKP